MVDTLFAKSKITVYTLSKYKPNLLSLSLEEEVPLYIEEEQSAMLTARSRAKYVCFAYVQLLRSWKGVLDFFGPRC